MRFVWSIAVRSIWRRRISKLDRLFGKVTPMKNNHLQFGCTQLLSSYLTCVSTCIILCGPNAQKTARAGDEARGMGSRPQGEI